jgi:hypothetical protein
MGKDDNKFGYERTSRWMIFFEVAAFLVLIVYTTFAGLQWEAMHDALLVDQRAWLSVVIPTNFPLAGAFIPASIQIANTGKTPAKDVEGDIVATVLKKGEQPSFDFSLGHPHNRIFAGAIFPNEPINTAISLVRYGPQTPQNIVPTPQLREEIANGESFILFYGKITYIDVFGSPHWTQFCTGSGAAIQTIELKKCINYNDVDGK